MSTAIIHTRNLLQALTEDFNALLNDSDFGTHKASTRPILRQIAFDIHLSNANLWAEEDLARRTLVSDAEIVKNKRNIDRLNQRRNDSVERFDCEALEVFSDVDFVGNCSSLSSETLGAMVDRLSIVSLKIFHSSKIIDRLGIGSPNKAVLFDRISVLKEQRKDLAASIMSLFDDMTRGSRYFKVYRQYKMYNDPRFNPELIAEMASKD